LAEIRVMLSPAFKPHHLELIPQFERATGHKVESLWVSTANMVGRLKDGEAADLVIGPSLRLQEMVKAGLVAPGTTADLARSGIGVAVRAGAQRPDISSGEALKRAVLGAKSIVYSTGPSGLYLAALFERMGIADEIRSRTRIAQGELAGTVVARGDAEIGFQQMSELLPVSGIDLVGPLPPDIQEFTTFSTGVPVRAKEPAAAKALVAHFKAPAAIPVIRKWGMEPC